MITEEEAKTKWCPMAKVLKYRNAGGVNRNLGTPFSPSDDFHANCIGSACMMWRSTPVDLYRVGINGLPSQTFPAGSGYCGLAGQP